MTDSLLKYISIICFVAVFGCESTDKEIPAPKIYFKEENIEQSIGDTVKLIPKITYDYNSSYKWYKNDEELTTERNIEHISTELGEIVYKFVVETPKGRDSAYVTINTMILIDFNNYSLDDDKYDIGTNLSENGFIFNDILLPANPVSDNEWEGFAMSNMYSTTTDGSLIYSAYAPLVKKDVFTILRLSQSSELNTIQFIDDKNYVVGNISVCNSNYVYNITKFGDEELGIRRFEARSTQNPKGDSLIVNFSGYDNNGISTGVVSFPLSDYRFENKSKNYIVDKFTTVDLKSLGAVNKIVIEMFSSLNVEDKMLTPPYVCFDNLKIYDIEE